MNRQIRLRSGFIVKRECAQVGCSRQSSSKDARWALTDLTVLQPLETQMSESWRIAGGSILDRFDGRRSYSAQIILKIVLQY